MNVRTWRCFQHVQWQPDRAELRRFAGGMLLGFGVLGLIVALRRHQLAAPTLILWGIGLGLAVGAMIPGLGRAVYLAVYLPTSVIGFGVSHLLLTLIFVGVVTPTGVALRLMGKDLLRRQPPQESSLWIPREESPSRSSYYRQF